MKRKIRYDRLFLVIMIAVMLLVVSFLGIKFLFFNNGSENDKPKPTTPVEKSDNISFSLKDYEVYSSEELNFRFVLADIEFVSKDKKGIEFDLAKLETNELVQLSNIDTYLNAFQAANYSLNKLEIVREIKSDSSKMTARLFIPVIKKGNSITLSNLNNSDQVSIDLSQNAGDIEKFKNTSGETVTDGESYDMYVSNAYVSTTMYRGEESYTYPATVKVYTFKIVVNELKKEGVVIEEAYFIPKGSNEEYQALDAEFSSMKDDNIIGKSLKNNDTYALFFELYNPDDSGISYDGTLRLKFANSNQVVEISTHLD